MNPEANAQPTLHPTAPRERLLALDVLRGLALLGVLLVNLGEFSGSDGALAAGLPYPMGTGGAALAFLRSALLETKSAALLAMLFGAGLAIQAEQAAAQARPFLGFALRRVGALALLGLAHSLLLWNIDILLDYALISLLVLPCLRLRPSRILWAIPVLLPVTLLFALPLLLLPAHTQPAADSYAQGLAHYGNGTWLEALRFRVWELLYTVGPERLANRIPILTPFFVLGVFAWKQGWLKDPAAHRRTLIKVFAVCFVLGLAANLLPQARLHEAVAQIAFQPLRILIKATAFFARPGLTVGYLAAILLLLQAPAWQRMLGVFAPLGRTTLTQYLLQSVVCTLVFNGYGLGLYGRVPMNAIILGGLAFFILQVWSSHLWLAHFETGPAEWLWRRLAYGAKRAANPATLNPTERPADA